MNFESDSKAVDRLIKDAGPRFSHLTPRTLCRSMYAAIVDDGLGWALAIGAGGRNCVPHVERPATSIDQLAQMVERFHPLGALNSGISNSQGEE